MARHLPSSKIEAILSSYAESSRRVSSLRGYAIFSSPSRTSEFVEEQKTLLCGMEKKKWGNLRGFTRPLLGLAFRFAPGAEPKLGMPKGPLGLLVNPLSQLRWPHVLRASPADNPIFLPSHSARAD
jgi:hypothetical protein